MVVLPGKFILIVAENSASRVSLANNLEGKHFKIFETPTGKEGLIADLRDRPFLALFDPTLLYPGGSFAAANNSDRSLTVKSAQDTTSIIQKETGEELVGLPSQAACLKKVKGVFYWN